KNLLGPFCRPWLLVMAISNLAEHRRHARTQTNQFALGMVGFGFIRVGQRLGQSFQDVSVGCRLTPLAEKVEQRFIGRSQPGGGQAGFLAAVNGHEGHCQEEGECGHWRNSLRDLHSAFRTQIWGRISWTTDAASPSGRTERGTFMSGAPLRLCVPGFADVSPRWAIWISQGIGSVQPWRDNTQFMEQDIL